MERTKAQQGRYYRRKGQEFELITRKVLEADGWTVNRWANNLTAAGEEYKDFSLVQARSNKFNMRSTGFPDFMCYRRIMDFYEILFVECKRNGKMDKLEKDKAQWYLEHDVCNKFFMAYDDDGTVEFKNIKYKGGEKE